MCHKLSHTDQTFSTHSGGHYAPAVASRIMELKNGGHKRGDDSDAKKKKLGVKTVGIISGFIDVETQVDSYPEFAVNNTYGIEAYNQSVADQAIAALGPCKEGVAQCRSLVAEKEPSGFLNDPEVAQTCGQAFQVCWGGVYLPYDILSGVSRPFTAVRASRYKTLRR